MRRLLPLVAFAAGWVAGGMVIVAAAAWQTWRTMDG